MLVRIGALLLISQFLWTVASVYAPSLPGAFRLNAACQWEPAPWTALVSEDARPPQADTPARRACFARRGGWSSDVKEILPRWPSQAELTAMRSRHESPLPADPSE